jgi:hypothetical protein
MVKDNKTVSSRRIIVGDKPLTNLLTLVKELELAMALSSKLSSRQAKQLQSAIIKLVKQI